MDIDIRIKSIHRNKYRDRCVRNCDTERFLLENTLGDSRDGWVRLSRDMVQQLDEVFFVILDLWWPTRWFGT